MTKNAVAILMGRYVLARKHMIKNEHLRMLPASATHSLPWPKSNASSHFSLSQKSILEQS